ncbi:hypothetical protein TSMEX_007554 [Taenia solium]|eukprot:TsM_000308600 transcript=TsM_000308600 gene=TsM_000308600
MEMDCLIVCESSFELNRGGWVCECEKKRCSGVITEEWEGVWS